MEKDIEILYIDDEKNNLIAFKAMLRRRYTVHIASNTIEAVNILLTHLDIRMIFCDQRMEGEQGVDFFERIKKEFPRPVRILLTALPDPEIVLDAINRGNVFRFMRKPWDEADMLSCIEEANRYYLTHSLLDLKNRELVKAYEELDKFAYSVSHDLKDPLSGIVGAIKIAMDFDRVEQFHEILELMRKSVVRLEEYIDNLGEYYLVRRGDLNLSIIDFEIIFENLIDFYNVFLKSRGVTINTFADQSYPFICDKSIIELILHNLISNAIKYQKKEEFHKTINVTVNTEPNQVVIIVEDNGIGIPRESQDVIFNLFHRASDQAEGMGFGLYNVKNAVQKLNGEIILTSKEGKGSTFKVIIPSKG
ncbi:sensor histidine kinase [Sphingobacterium sp. HJSM2_6]|uniref:sensor histidine kinase n=1 Tax=Sphingobacterium sp. HJSM2_6 TaxID=3366264 RepID=UPI003BECCAC7